MDVRRILNLNSIEINKRLREGEILWCPDCDLFYPETDGCEIICCNNPFTGPYQGEIEEHSKLIVNNFKSFYTKKKEA